MTITWKKLLPFIFPLAIVVALFFTTTVFAGTLSNNISAQLGAGAGSAGFDTANPTDLRILLPSLIQVALSMLGIVYMILIFMAGYNLLTARGQEEKVLKAKGTLRRATLGLVVVLLAYSISSFVGSFLEQAATAPAREREATGFCYWFGVFCN